MDIDEKILSNIGDSLIAIGEQLKLLAINTKETTQKTKTNKYNRFAKKDTNISEGRCGYGWGRCG